MTSALTADQRKASTHTGPPPKRPLGLARHSIVLARRGLVKIGRTPEGLADAIILPVVFLVMFVYLLGGAVSGSTHAYLQRIFPAAMVMTVVMAGTMTTGFTLNADIKKGIFDRFRSLPIGRSAPLIGSVAGDAIRYLVALAALFGFGYLLGFRAHAGLLPVLAACGLTITFAFCLSWAYVLVGVAVREPSGVQAIAIVSLFPLVFGTDLIAPVATMPGWLQAWVRANPLTHAMDACRALLLGGPVAGPLIMTLLWSAGLLAVFAPLAVLVYRRQA